MLTSSHKLVDSKKLINHYNIIGEKILFFYHQRLPIIAFAEGDKIDIFINYFLDPDFFHQPPCWIVLSFQDTERVYKYEQGKYIFHIGDVSIDEMILESKPILLTPIAARVVLKGVYKENEDWLQNDRSRKAISTIPRIFSEHDTLIYELIQNAYDSNASSVSIELDEKALVFSHNGIPFTESDVNSISFVNLSTKGKDKVGFMGIGFKSVFLVSKKPEIHSYPFSFQFNCEENKYGFILPTNIDRKEMREPFTTLIFIPLTESILYKSLNNSLLPYKHNTVSGISSKTFLHLVKETKEGLTGITEIRTPYTEMRLKQGQLDSTFEINNTVEEKLEHELWLRLESQCTPDKDEIKDFLTTRQIQDKNLLEETWSETVSIAIKIIKNENIFSPDLNYQGIINVYLPTKVKTGLRFDLQGNFLVSASRDGLKNTNGGWNTKLFCKISDLLIDLLKWCKSNSNSNQINVAKFYSVIPNWENFFLDDELAEQIKESFKKQFTLEALVPIESEKDENVQFCFPEQCIIVDKQIFKLLGKKIIEEYTGRKIVLQDIDNKCINNLTEMFEIKEWTIDDTLDYFQNGNWYNNIPKLKKQKQWNNWLTKLYSYFDCNISYTNFNINKLIRCFVFPISWDSQNKIFEFITGDNLYRLPHDKPFIPFDIKDKNNINILNQSFDNFLSGRTVTKEDEIDKSHLKNAREFLDEISIKRLDVATVIEDFILPVFDNVHGYELNDVVRYTRYIGRHFNEIKKKVRINTILLLNRKGEFCNPKNLYFGKEYQARELEVFFGKLNSELFVSEVYIQDTAPGTMWIDMFKNLGVNDKPAILPINNQISYSSKKGIAIRESLGLPYPRTSYVNSLFPGDKYLYVNYDFNENVKKRIEEISKKSFQKDSMTAFLHLLDENWGYYAKYDTCEVQYFAYMQTVYDTTKPYSKRDKIRSSFFQYLIDSKWVPVKNSNDLCFPNQVYVATEEDKQILSDVLFCNGELSNEDFIKAVGFKTFEGNISTFDRLLAKTKKGEKSNYQFKEMYTLVFEEYKDGRCSKEEIKSFFENNKVIYGGERFWAASDVLYKPDGPLRLYLPSLVEIYPDLEEFFIDILEVAEKEPTISIIRRFFLDYLWVSERGMNDEFRNAIIYGYRRLLSYLNGETTNLTDYRTDWLEFRENAKVFCKNNVGWVGTKSEKPILYLDNGKYEKQYINSGKVFIESHLTQLRRETDELLPMLKLLNIVPESLAINEVNFANGTHVLYPDQPIVVKNLHYLYQVIISIIDWVEVDKNESVINTFSNKVKQLYDSNHTIYKVDEIISSIQLGDNELLKLERSCMFEVERQELFIYVVDEIKIIYGGFKDELISLLNTGKLPVELRNYILNLITNTVGNIEDECFKASINRYLKEIGYVSETLIKDGRNFNKKTTTTLTITQEKEHDVNKVVDKHEIEIPEKIDPNVQQDNQRNENPNEKSQVNLPEKLPKQPYYEIIQELDLDKIIIIDGATGNPLAQNTKCGKPNNKPNGRSGGGSRVPFNKYSEEDGARGEDAVFDAEKKRLREIGLSQYIGKINHVSKVRKGNPWDIESFDKKSDGKIVPIRIEVKSTTEESNYIFPMSSNEYHEALIDDHEKGDLYIYRVFNVRLATPPIERFNFKEYVKVKRIRVKMKDIFIEVLAAKNSN